VRIGIIGCGFVFDKYMATWGSHPDLVVAGVTDIDAGRVDAVTRHYGLKGYADNAALLVDPSIGIVANFTPIKAHYEVTKAALEAGKHVYSEKPLALRMDQARELFALAESRGLRLSCAPSSALGASTQTMWKAVSDGAVGRARLVYAEYDADPLYLVASDGSGPSTVGAPFPYLNERSTMSVTGAPFPFIEEFEMGCTYEHVGYQLSWMCMISAPSRASPRSPS
jgi:predicted dehydrogenase